jgi:hypothetical protein
MQYRMKCHSPAQVLEFAQLDSWRAQRTGFPEVVFGQGKSPEQIVAIMQQLAKNEQIAMATRVNEEVWLPSCMHIMFAMLLCMMFIFSSKVPLRHISLQSMRMRILKLLLYTVKFVISKAAAWDCCFK